MTHQSTAHEQSSCMTELEVESQSSLSSHGSSESSSPPVYASSTPIYATTTSEDSSPAGATGNILQSAQHVN